MVSKKTSLRFTHIHYIRLF